VKYKLLALDLDGTTLNSAHQILPSVKQEIARIKQDAIVLLVTGRHHSAAKPYYYELELDTPIISCNGTYMYDYHRGVILAENSIPKANAEKFVELASQHQLKMVMYVTESMTYSRTAPVDYMVKLEQWAQGYSDALKPSIRRIDSFQTEIASAEYVWKFVVEGEINDVRAFAEDPFIASAFSGEKSWSNRIDFSNVGNTKGARLAQYLEQIGIKPAEIVAIGDNHNDISMIELAGLGVAMSNADEDVKRMANIATRESNDGLGIAEIIATYF
jgi:Cof subfamily protein (haloacid dehalogenase superfamily)